MRYRKKPIEIEAFRWTGGDFKCLEQFCGRNWGRNDTHGVDWAGPDDEEYVVIWNQLESQWICCPVGHWVIRGIKGELYPCDPDVFSKTYEAA